MHYLSSVYFDYQLLHVSGVFIAHHQEAHRIYIQQLVLIVLFSWLSVVLVALDRTTHSQLQAQHIPIVIYIQCTSWRWDIKTPETCRSRRNMLRINRASSWFYLHEYIEMHGQQNIKFIICVCLSVRSHISSLTVIILNNSHEMISIININSTVSLLNNRVSTSNWAICFDLNEVLFRLLKLKKSMTKAICKKN